MQALTVNDIVIQVERKNIKNLHLAVHPPMGRVRIAAPFHMGDDAIRLFAISKLNWIRKNQIKFEQQQRQPVREYLSGESHYFQGQRYLLNLIDSDKNRVVLRKKHIDLFVVSGLGSDYDKRMRMMNHWYKQQLQQSLSTYLDNWQKTMGLKIVGYSIRLMKTKWGSCNLNKKHLCFNLELAKKPLHCLEYVVVHELVHLLERKHNAQFSAYMDRFMPQWRIYRDELNHFVLDDLLDNERPA